MRWPVRDDLTVGQLKAILAELPDESEVCLLDRTDEQQYSVILLLRHQTAEKLGDVPGSLAIHYVHHSYREGLEALLREMGRHLDAEQPNG
jgi:hypothetical protein